jgi:hypothetical protein
MDVLTLDPGGDREALPVFSFEEEAETFLQLEMPGMGWLATRTTAGELVSLLHGPCAGVERVALDPLPTVCGETMVDLVSLGRENFLRNLAHAREPSASRDGFRVEVAVSPDLLESPEGTPETEKKLGRTENGAAQRIPDEGSQRTGRVRRFRKM